MRINTSFILVVALLSSSASASWFSSNKEYTSWDKSQLQSWLKYHNINVPKGYDRDELEALVKENWDQANAWTAERVAEAQKHFDGVKEDSFATWDESRLRQFLVDHGIVAPSGPKEKLVSAAKQQYASYTSAKSSLGAQASTAVYGNAASQASKSIYSAASDASASASSAAAWASTTAERKLRDSQDYIYSTWDDNQLRSYLEENGYIKSKSQATRDQLLAKMKQAYADVMSPIYQAWSDSYMHEWLVSHGIIKSDYEKNRDKLDALLNEYYYDSKDTVWNTWSDSELKAWLVEHDIIKSDAQVRREKMQKLVADNYANARDTIWASWTDSEIRSWLIDNGYLRSDAQVKRDELVKLFNEKYNDASARTATYLTWPDARLRAWLRSNGYSEEYLPTGRPSLLHEVRIRWVQTNNRVESLLNSIRLAISNSVETCENKLTAILELLTGTKDQAVRDAEKYASEASRSASSAGKSASSVASSVSKSASKSASSAYKSAKNEL
jgi:hypothetical protein